MGRILVLAMLAASACRGGSKPSPVEASALSRFGEVEAGYARFEVMVAGLLANHPYCATPGARDDAYHVRTSDAIALASHRAGMIDATVEVLCDEAIAEQISVADSNMMIDGTAASRVRGRRISWGTAITPRLEMNATQVRALAVESFVTASRGRVRVLALYPFEAAR